MKKIIINLLLLFLPMILLRGEEKEGTAKEGSTGLIGSVFSINADFDIYRIHKMDRNRTPLYYMIMPAPDHAIGGIELDYFGRMPRETKLQIVKIGRSKYLRRIKYWVKPISPVNDRLKGNSSRKVHASTDNLDDQIYLLSSIASNVGLYEKGHYSNGLPRLNETWFTVIELKE